jgi:hypothetical protein
MDFRNQDSTYKCFSVTRGRMAVPPLLTFLAPSYPILHAVLPRRTPVSGQQSSFFPPVPVHVVLDILRDAELLVDEKSFELDQAISMAKVEGQSIAWEYQSEWFTRPGLHLQLDLAFTPACRHVRVFWGTYFLLAALEQDIISWCKMDDTHIHCWKITDQRWTSVPWDQIKSTAEEWFGGSIRAVPSEPYPNFIGESAAT